MPAPTSRLVDGAYQRRDTQVPPYEWDGSLFVVRGKREGRRPPPREGWGRRPCGIRRGDCAICGWRFGTMGEFAPCAGRPEALPLDSAILGCTPSVGKSGRRGILRQAKAWIRSHTGCMARNRTAGMAQKARRAPQTHGRWAAPQEKNRVKFLYFLLTGVVTGGTGVHTAWQGRPLPFPDTAGTNGCPSHTWS